nr:reverse transcriptase domain, reverse transcriptase zinc-binding domain protein [Tanacetum cinerariifolium]
MSNMVRWMGCDVAEFPFTYLGLPIGENIRRVNDWNTVVENFKKKLGDWKAKTFLFRGRLTLVKSVLGWWRFRKEGENIWARVIKSIHDEGGGLEDVREMGG